MFIPTTREEMDRLGWDRADILLVDEILAVGDYKFQQKCHERMSRLLADGTTLLFVSHNEDQVKELCGKAVWLDHGRMMATGDVNEVYEAYHRAVD